MTQSAAATPSTYPGKTLGIVGLIVAIFFSLIGLIISVIAFNQSKAAGFKNTPAKAGIIIGAVFLVLGIIGEYVGRTLRETRRRPNYVVAETEADARQRTESARSELRVVNGE